MDVLSDGGDDAFGNTQAFIDKTQRLFYGQIAADEILFGVKTSTVVAMVVENVHRNASPSDEVQKLCVEAHLVETVKLPRLFDGQVKIALFVAKCDGVIFSFQFAHREDVARVIFCHVTSYKTVIEISTFFAFVFKLRRRRNFGIDELCNCL